MDTAVAIVSFGSGGMIEVRAEPPEQMLLEVRSQTGTARTTTHEWHPGRGGVRLIRYQRGEAVEQRPVLPGQVQRIVTGRSGESLRLQGVGEDGGPRVLDFRVVSAASLTGTHGAVGMTGAHGAIGGSPGASLEVAGVPSPHPTGAVPAMAPVAPPAADVSAIVAALDARLQPQLAQLMGRVDALEGRIAATPTSDPRLTQQLDVLTRLVEAQAMPAAPPVDLAPVLARLDALTRATSLSSKPTQAPVDLGPVLDRLDALDVRVASTALDEGPDLSGLTEQLTGLDRRLAELAAASADPTAAEARISALEARLTQAMETARPDLMPVAEAFRGLEARLSGDDLVQRLASALPPPPNAEVEAERLGKTVDAALDARLLPLGLNIDKGLESRLIPIFAALDRADRERALAQERDHAITDRLVSLETRLDDEGGLGGRLAATHERITRLATQVGEALAGGERLDAVAEHLTRIERLLLAAPSLDGRLTAMQAQIGRIEEGAGSITPELIELIASKLETLDPRAGMADLDARVFGFSRRLDEITAHLSTGLGADSHLGTLLTGTLGRVEAEQARLAAGLATLAPALSEGLTPLAAEAAARTRAQAAMAESLEGALAELRALNERVDPAPALAEVRSRLDGIEDGEHTAQILDRLRANLEALAARPAPEPPIDHTEALLRIDEQIGRLDRHIRSDGKQVDKAIAAAMAAVRSFSDDGQLELIQERLELMEKRTGGIDPRVVEQLESAARKMRDAGPGADLTPVLDRLDELGRRVTQMPPMQPPVVEFGDLESKVDALAAQLAVLGQSSGRDLGPSPELLHLGVQLDQLNARIEGLAAAPTGGAAVDLRAIELRLDALADLFTESARGLRDAPNLDDSGVMSALEAQLDALDAGHLPSQGGGGSVGALAAQLNELFAKVDALGRHLDHGKTDGNADGNADAMSLLTVKIDALTARVEDSSMARQEGPELGPLFGLVERLGSRVDALADRVDVLAGRLSTPPGLGLPLAGPEVDVPLDAAEESIDISSFPPGNDGSDDDDVLDAPSISVPPPVAGPARPEPTRRSSDGAMLDGLDQLIDVIQTRHVDQQSVRGLLAQPRLDSLKLRLAGVRDAFAGRLPASTSRLMDQLVERIDESGLDPLHAAQLALAKGDFADAIQKVARALQGEGQAPLNTENVERTVLGISKAVWDADPALAATEGPAREALEALLGELELVLILPALNTSWLPKDQRVQGRRPGRPGEPLNLVLEVHAPGFRRGETVVDKAAVTISD